MSLALDFIREQDPRLKDVDDKELSEFVRDTYPDLVDQDPELKRSLQEFSVVEQAAPVLTPPSSGLERAGLDFQALQAGRSQINAVTPAPINAVTPAPINVVENRGLPTFPGQSALALPQAVPAQPEPRSTEELAKLVLGPTEEETQAKALQDVADLKQSQRNALAKDIQALTPEKLATRLGLSVGEAGGSLKEMLGGAIRALQAGSLKVSLSTPQQKALYNQIIGKTVNEIGEGLGIEGRATREKYAQLGRRAGLTGPAYDIPGEMATTGLVSAPVIPAAALGGMPAAVTFAGLQSLGSTYEEAVQSFMKAGDSKEAAEEKALLPAFASGAITAGLTGAFGKTGTEAIARGMTRGSVTGIIREIFKEAGMEAAEELIDQVGQSIVQRLSYNPELTLSDAVSQSLQAAAAGGLLGGATRAGMEPVGAVTDKLRGEPLPKSPQEAAALALGKELREGALRGPTGAESRPPGRTEPGRRISDEEFVRMAAEENPELAGAVLRGRVLETQQTERKQDALQPESTPVLRPVREQPDEGTKQVPTEEDRKKADEGRGEVRSRTQEAIKRFGSAEAAYAHALKSPEEYSEDEKREIFNQTKAGAIQNEWAGTVKNIETLERFEASLELQLRAAPEDARSPIAIQLRKVRDALRAAREDSDAFGKRYKEAVDEIGKIEPKEVTAPPAPVTEPEAQGPALELKGEEPAPEAPKPEEIRSLTKKEVKTLNDRFWPSEKDIPSVERVRKRLDKAQADLNEAQENFNDDENEDTQAALDEAQKDFNDLTAVLKFAEEREVAARKKAAGQPEGGETRGLQRKEEGQAQGGIRDVTPGTQAPAGQPAGAAPEETEKMVQELRRRDIARKERARERGEIEAEIRKFELKGRPKTTKARENYDFERARLDKKLKAAQLAEDAYFKRYQDLRNSQQVAAAQYDERYVNAKPAPEPKAEPKLKTKAEAEAAKLPPVKEGHVRLFHGEGGTGGAGLGDAWYTPNVSRAASYGPRLSWVDVPKAVADANRQNVSDVVLPAEWLKKAATFDVPIEQEAIDLEAPVEEPKKAPAEEPKKPAETKGIRVRRDKDFETTGTYTVTMADNQQWKIYKDPESKQWYVENHPERKPSSIGTPELPIGDTREQAIQWLADHQKAATSKLREVTLENGRVIEFQGWDHVVYWREKGSNKATLADPKFAKLITQTWYRQYPKAAPAETKQPEKPAKPAEKAAEPPTKTEVKEAIEEGAEGTPKSPKEVKSALLQKVEARLDSLAAEAEDKPTESAEGRIIVNGQRTIIADYTEEKGKFSVTIAKTAAALDKNLTFTADSRAEMLKWLAAAGVQKPGTITVKVPGDGEFTIPNGGLALIGLHGRIKSIDTRTKPTLDLKKPSPPSIAKQASKAIEIYGDAETAYKRVEAQLKQQEADLKDTGDWKPAMAARGQELLQAIREQTKLPTLEAKAERLKLEYDSKMRAARVTHRHLTKLEARKTKPAKIQEAIKSAQEDLESELAEADKLRIEHNGAAREYNDVAKGIGVAEKTEIEHVSVSDLDAELKQKAPGTSEAQVQRLVTEEEAKGAFPPSTVAGTRKVLAMDPDEFKKFSGTKGFKPWTYDVADSLTLDEVRQIQELQRQTKEKTDAAKAEFLEDPESEAAANAYAAMASKGQMLREIYEYVTGKEPTKFESYRKVRPDYKPRFTEEQVEATPKAEEERPTKDLWEMSDAELEAFLGEQVPDILEIGRRGKYTFDTYNQFKAYMDARYAERDLEGMRLAYTEADTPFKVRYIKENRESAAHKRDWISHLATGSPLPGEDPPKPRTTPRPTATGGTEPVPGTEGPKPPKREPPPDFPNRYGPSKLRSFNITALVQLARTFGKFPSVNKRLVQAYGRYIRSRPILTAAGTIVDQAEVLPFLDEVELAQRLLWDQELARRVIAHELGHFIDLGTRPKAVHNDFFKKFVPLGIFRRTLANSATLTAAAKKLSADWRGPFSPQDRYRNSGVELFADVMSAMFVNPDWVYQKYPQIHDAFEVLLENKPEFRRAYNLFQEYISGEQVVKQVRGQMEQATDKTMEILAKERKREGKSWTDFLKGALVTRWHRAIDVEGKLKRIGDSLKDLLETSHTWAILQDTLVADDMNKRVFPQLKKVSENTGDALKWLNQYSQARRTIGERRAAGKWIEDNPEEAREMLKQVLALSRGFTQKYGAALQAVPDEGLYDFAAMVFREIHDQGPAFVQVVSRAIDALDLDVRGAAALMAFNVRGKLLNPGGLTPETAQQLLDEVKAELGPDRWAALEKAAEGVREIFFDLQKKARDEGLISKKTWDELIAPNKDNYVPYAVLDYFDGKVRGGVLPQSGTAKDVADTTMAMQLKASSLNAWRQHQRQVKLVQKMYEKGGKRARIGRGLKGHGELAEIRQKNAHDDISRSNIWIDGKQKLIEFPGDPGKSLEQAFDSRSLFQHMEWISDMSNLVHTGMQFYTTFSSAFLLFRNPLRGARTTGVRNGILSTLKTYFSKDFADSFRQAYNYANAAFGQTMLPEVREMVENEVITAPRVSSSMLRDLTNLRELMVSGSALIAQAYRHQLPTKRTFLGTGFEKVRTFLDRVFTTYEAFEKIQAYKSALTAGRTKEQAAALARRAGIPKPGVGGHFTMPLEIFMPWTRVHIQGTRADFEMVMDPEKRAGFLGRVALTEIAPRAAKFALATGVISGAISWLLSGDEDDDDPVMAEVMQRISPYKMAIEDVVPLAFYDSRNGTYHYFNEFKRGSDIPKHFEVVSMRIPASEQGRLWGTLFYSMLVNLSPQANDLKRPGETPVSAFGQWVKNYAAPGINPLIETSRNLYTMILEGKNPEDPYRGQPAANEQLFEAGGKERAEAIAGYALNQLGGPGQLAATLAMNFGVLDDRASGAVKRRLASDKQPFLEKFALSRAMVSYDNYADYRERKISDLEEEKLRAQSRLLMPDNVRGLYDFYWRNREKKGEMDAVDYGKLRAASLFVSKIWGKLDDPDSFYSKAAHSVTDGSPGNKETFQRDIELAAQPYLAIFDNPSMARFSTVLHYSDKDTVKAEMDAPTYQKYEKRLDQTQAALYEKLRKHPKWDSLTAEEQRDLKLWANQAAREDAAQFILTK